MPKKLYSNSWAAPLTTEQRWQVFEKSVTARSWDEAARWAVKEFNLPKMPSHAAWFRWCKSMSKQEHDYRIQQALLTKAGVMKELDKIELKDNDAAAAILSMAVSIGMELKDWKTCVSLVQAATALKKTVVDQERFNEYKRNNERMEAEREEMKRIANGEDLTDEEMAAKIREILGA